MILFFFFSFFWIEGFIQIFALLAEINQTAESPYHVEHKILDNIRF